MAHDGTYTNSPTLGVAGLAPGDVAASFDTNSAQYVVQDDTLDAQSFTACTLGMLVEPSAVLNGATIWGVDGNTDSILFAQFGGAGKINFLGVDGANPSSSFNLASATSLVNGTGYCVIGTWDGTTVNLDINGVTDATASYTDPLQTVDPEHFYAAADQFDLTPNAGFSGVLGRVFFVANHAATAGEKQAIVDAFNGSGDIDSAILALSPYIFWKLNETSGTIAADSSGGSSSGNFRFTPPTENTVSNVAYDVPPLGNRLMRYYPTRPRGKAVWHLEDDTISFDQPYPTVFPDAAQHSDLWPVPPVSNWWGSNLVAVTAKTVYYGGHTYIVDQAEEALLAAFLTAQGYTPSDWLVPL